MFRPLLGSIAAALLLAAAPAPAQDAAPQPRQGAPSAPSDNGGGANEAGQQTTTPTGEPRVGAPQAPVTGSNGGGGGAAAPVESRGAGTAAPAANGQGTTPAQQTTPVSSAASPAPGGAYDYPNAADTTPDTQTWYTFNADIRAQKYATSDQITPDNVGKLQVAWEVHTGDVADGSGDKPPTVWSATPLFVNDTVYVSTPFYRILALDPATGEQKWAFDPKAVLKAETQPDLKTRGVAYWANPNPQQGQPCQKIVYIGTMDAKLYAVDADTGKACEDFGDKGLLDVNQWNTVNGKWPLSLLQPPTVYKNMLFIGWAGKDWADKVAPPGNVFAVDAQSGKLIWTFNILPPNVIPNTGTANVWASMSVDPENNLLFLPISSPSPDFYGGDRSDPIPLANSVTALDADTGQVVWSRQLVHHDIWDYDTNSAPVLVDINKGGQTIPALIQSTKQGFLFVLNRLTGDPIYPIEETPVPASDVEGEQAAPTQPEEHLPEPTTPDKFPGISTLADIASFGQCSREFASLRYEGRFTPPSVRGTLAYPATAGGVEWGGGALDPTSNTYVVNSSSVAQIYRLIPRDEYEADTKNGTPAGYSPQTGAPFGLDLHTFLNWLGMPCWNGPYGTMSSYDLNTGQLNWRVPFGQVQKYGFYMPASWGSVTIGAPVVTKSGLIFAGGSMDARVRALDLKTGKELWQSLVEAPAVAMPAVYTYKGREYVVFAVGGNTILKPQVSDQLIAYALPQDKDSGG